VNLAQRYDKSVNLDSSLLAGPFVYSDMSDLGIRVGAPRNYRGAESLAPEEQGVLDYDSRGGIGSVSKFIWQANVTGGVDPAVGGLQKIIYCHALFVVRHASDFEVQALHIGRPSNANEDFIYRDDVSLAASL